MEYLFSGNIASLLEDADRQYGVANNNRTDYILERLEMTLGTCSDLLHHIREQTEAEELEECVTSLRELIDCIKVIYRKWAELKRFLILLLNPKIHCRIKYMQPGIHLDQEDPNFRLERINWNICLLLGSNGMKSQHFWE